MVSQNAGNVTRGGMPPRKLTQAEHRQCRRELEMTQNQRDALYDKRARRKAKTTGENAK
jgi:hypothetical protein